jgi:hypothetical protein
MANWNLIFSQSIEIPKERSPFSLAIYFEVDSGIRRLRLSCQTIPSIITEEPERAAQAFQDYVDHPAIQSQQKDLLCDSINKAFYQMDNSAPAALLFDSSDTFRGRWDPTFSGRKEIGEWRSADGFESGEIRDGKWTLLIYTPNPVAQAFRRHITIETSTEPDECSERSENLSIQNDLLHEVNLAWFVGELHEHTTRSSGFSSPDETVTIYENLGYHFLALTDHDYPPLRYIKQTPPITLLRGQEIQWPFGHALLLGIHEWFPPNPHEKIDHLREIIHEVHALGGLFCALHPFAMQADCQRPFWPIPLSQWNLIDLLEIWPGSWCKRFPETLKSFDFWDRLLNQGHRIFATCGKGSSEPAEIEILEKSPKTIVLSEGQSETQILSALKQGHFYCTSEPAVSIHVESEYGGAFMGDELRIPNLAPFILYVDINQMERAFLRIKTNKGIYCETPAASARDTKLKFYEHASAEIQWFRVEIYRYGRPLDELLAFSNPVFVRGMVSS